MGTLREEGKDAVRSLRRAPGHAATCLALLTIGLASTTAILAVGNGLLGRPLPVRDGDRLLIPYGSRGDDKRLLASTYDAEAWRSAPSLAGFAVARMGAVTLDVDGEPTRVGASQIEAGYFPVLGVGPILGRTFSESEARRGRRLAILGSGLWQRRFGGDPGIVGRSVRIDDDAWEVIGVMPRGFDQPYESEIWRPLDLAAVPEEERGARVLDPVARLAPGRSIDDARAELSVIARRLEKERPDTNLGWGVRALPLRQSLMQDPGGTVARAVGVTFWGAALLLLIACANVAQLQIVRVSGRGVELATRSAIGGSRGSLARMLALETLTLLGAATLLGAPLSWALAQGLLRLSPVSPTAFASRMLSVSYDARVAAAVAAIVVLTGLAAGAYPALRASRAPIAPLLTGGARAGVSRRQHLFLEQAVLAQVALAVTLLSATGALGESYARLRGMDLGFRPAGVTYYQLSLSPRDYADHERRAAFADALVAAVNGIDGARAAFTTDMPLSAQSWVAGYGCEGRDLAPGEELIAADRLVGPGYLETMGVRLLAGRTITDRDLESSEPVAVINESLAEECWPGEAVTAAVGRRVLRIRRSGRRALRVVGVVADARELRVSFRGPHTAWYLPYRQHDILRDLYLVTRGGASPAQVRAIVRRLDPHQPVAAPRRLTEHLAEVTGSDRMAALVMGYFAAVGLVLVAVGIHGSMRRYVGQQRRAIGTRMAFGAAPRRIVGMVVGRGLVLAAIGAAIGVLGAAALQRLTAGFVFGAVLGAPLRFGLTALAVLAIAGAACLAPAWQASRIDPSGLLRE